MATYRIHAEVTVDCYADVEARSAHEAIEKAKEFAHVVTSMRPEAWGDEQAFFVDPDEMDGTATNFRPEPAPKGKGRGKNGGG